MPREAYLEGCGIYTIYLPETDQYYIGKSNNIYNRMKVHKCDLRKNRHARPELQKYFDEHGWEGFDIKIQVHCEEHELEEQEQKISVAMHSIGHNVVNRRIHTIVDATWVPRYMHDEIEDLVSLIDSGGLKVTELRNFINEKTAELEDRFNY